MAIIYIFIIVNILFSIIIWSILRKEKKKNRIMQAFIAGLIRSISDYQSSTDKINIEETPVQNTKLPIPYKKVIEAVEYELLKDFSNISVKNYDKWLRESRQLFSDERMGNDGFVFMNYDLFDGLIKYWYSGGLLTLDEKKYLREEVLITKNNVDELRDEILYYKDVMSGEFDMNNFNKEKIDDELSETFSHLKQEYLDNLKKEILLKK